MAHLIEYDGSLHEAIGWMIGLVPARALAEASHQAREAGYPEVAGHLLRWADIHASSLIRLHFEDRLRQVDADADARYSFLDEDAEL